MWPLIKLTFNVPASVAAPVVAILPYCVPRVVPPMEIFVVLVVNALFSDSIPGSAVIVPLLLKVMPLEILCVPVTVWFSVP